MEDNKDKIVGNKVKESKGAKIFRIAQSCLMISQIVLETLILIRSEERRVGKEC